MSRHRAEPPPRYRPRYGRIGVLCLSVATTAVGLLGGLGVLPSAAGDDSDTTPRAQLADRAVDPAVVTVADAPEDAVTSEPSEPSAPTGTGSDPAEPVESSAEDPVVADDPDDTDDLSAPADSGSGRRAIFSQSKQRVWLVNQNGDVKRTYLVSGSLTDNLQPGTYEVYSRSEDATGIDDSGTMHWFVRFTQGPSGAAIGFHSIPELDGEPVQSKSQLGTPQSHGCIRQKTTDAKAMWDFAQLGDQVVVIA